MKYYSSILILVLFNLLSAQDQIPPQDESFDPLQLHEPSLPFLDGSMIYEIITDIKAPGVKETADSDTSRVVKKMGYKVQLFSTTDFFKADTIYLKAVHDFIDQDVVKDFNSPYYKIRLGNCVTREEAEALLNRALALRYRDAWIIRTPIKTEEHYITY
jgi:hypothetical protein